MPPPPNTTPVNKLKVLGCSFLGLLTITTTARADVSMTLNTTTNYIYRGFSKSDDHAAVQFNLDYEFPLGVYLGSWASMVDFGEDNHEFDDRARVEVAPYLGWSTSLSEDWRFEVYATRYLYTGKVFGDSVDYNEFYSLIHFRDLASLQFAWAPELYAQGHPGFDYELALRYPLTESLQISGTIGLEKANKTLGYDYLYWDVGFSWFYHFAAFDFRYVQSAYPGPEKMVDWGYEPDKLDPTFVFTFSIGF